MCGADGGFVAQITPEFIDRLIAHMQERETLTGDLCPVVIGHTQDGAFEVDQPPLVGYARNWHKGLLGDTGRQCAFADLWIQKDRAEQAKQFPRRSAEVWASRFEIDPISLLGATTPARDLGLMRLSREGSMTYYPPGDTQMPDEKKKDDKPVDGKPAADPKETGASKGLEGKLDQLMGLVTQLLEMQTGGAGAAAKPGEPAPAGAAPAGAPAGDGQMSDEDFEKFLESMQGGDGAEPDPSKSRAGEKPVENEGGYCAPGQNDTVTGGKKAKMSRIEQVEQELADHKAELTRMQVKERLVKLARPDIADASDSQFVEDLVAMPPELRERTIVRLSRAPAAPGQSTQLARALDGAVANGTVGKRMDQETATKLSRKAVAEKKTFEQVAAEEGYDLSAR